jgi:hypothetical protein
MQRPVASSQRRPSGQGVSGQAGAQYAQHPPVHQPVSQSVSELHSVAHPAPPQIEPRVHAPHSVGQSESTRQAGMLPGSKPGQ